MEAAPEIEAEGARLVVVTPQSADRAATWRDEVSLGEALVIANPKRTLYKALGARRPKPLWSSALVLRRWACARFSPATAPA